MAGTTETPVSPAAPRRAQAATGECGRVGAGRPEKLKRPRRAATLGDGGRFEQAQARVDGDGVRRRHVRRWRRPRPAHVPPALLASPTLDLEDGERSGVPAAAARLQKDDLRQRQPVALRHAKGAHEGGEVQVQQVALHFPAAQGVRPVEDPDLTVRRERGLGRPHGGGGEGVVPRAHILEIDHQQIATIENAGLGAQAGGIVAVEGDHRRARPRIPLVARGDHVLVDAVEAVLRTQQSRRRLRRCQSQVCVDAAATQRRLVAQKRVATALQTLGVVEQSVKTGTDRHGQCPVFDTT